MARQQPPSTRAAKVAGATKASRSKPGRGLSLIWVALGLVLVLIVGGVGWAISQSPSLDVVRSYDDLGRDHVGEAVSYDQSPPVGGDHNPAWWDCGVYEEPVPNHHAVHSLEHGAVWLTYQPDLAADQVDTLRDLAGQEFMLLSPDPDQDSPVVASAWGNQLKLDRADDPRIPLFIKEYRQGPQTPEPGAACTGGTTTDLVTGR